MLEASNISKSFGAHKLFGPVDFRIDSSMVWALLGPNGSGKTTLMRILAGMESSDSGEVRKPRGVEIGYLPQEVEVGEEGLLLDFVENAAGELKEVAEELFTCQAALATCGDDPEVLDRYGHLQSRYEYLGGYTMRAQAKRILAGLGFSEADFYSELAKFSGGWRMRALLARILLKKPPVILLDEPTNHLDIVTLQWLENFIRQSDASFLIVSHDVSFLDRVVDGVMSLEPSGLVRLKGSWSQYVAAREIRMEQARAAWQSQQRKRAEEQKFIDRFRSKNTKAKQVQSRIKRMDKEVMVEAPIESFANRPAIRFPQPERSGKDVVKIEGVRAGYGSGVDEKIVYESLDFSLYRGEKVALIGPNGAGKSTLLKLLAGVVTPLAGSVDFGHNVTVSYFSQHQMEQLSPNRTVLEEMLLLPGVRREKEARDILGGFLFSGDTVEKKVAVLSGGEKSRLALARMMATPGNLLLLDEPTNHLDIDACEVLKGAIERFEGACAVITHDRDLINRVADRVVYVEGGGYREYPGNFDDYERKRKCESDPLDPVCQVIEKGKGAPLPTKGKEARRVAAHQRKKLDAATKPLKKQIEKCETELGTLQLRVGEIEALLSMPENFGDPARAAPLSRELKDSTARIDQFTAQWEEATIALEEIESELAAGQCNGE